MAIHIILEMLTDGGSIEDAVFEGQPEVVQVEQKSQPLRAVYAR